MIGMPAYVYDCVVRSLMEQVKKPRCKAVVGVLNAAQSKQLIKWRQLVGPTPFKLLSGILLL